MESIWSESCCFKEQEQLCGDIQAEIAVIGAGIAGLLTASALQKAGLGSQAGRPGIQRRRSLLSTG